MKSFIYVLSRMSTAIFILSFLAVASVLGTYILQNRPEEEYINLFGDFWCQVFSYLGLFDLYSSWWFIDLLLILMASIVVCLWNNGRQIWKRQELPKRALPASLLKGFTQVETSLNFEGFIHKSKDLGLSIRVYEGAAYASQSKKYIYGYWAMHISVLLFSIYGLANAFFGWRGVMNLAEGEGSRTAYLFKGDVESQKTIPFYLKNNEFSIDFYDTGMPKNFETDLHIVDLDRKTVLDKHLLQVNKPYISGRYSVYQGTFGDAGSAISYSLRPVSDDDLVKVKNEEFDISVYKKIKIDEYELEFTNFKLHNVENVGEAEKFGRQFENLGPSVEYIIRGPQMSAIQLKSYLNNPHVFAVSIGDTDTGPVYANYILGLRTDEDLGWPMAVELAKAIKADKTDKEVMEVTKKLAPKYLAGLEPKERLVTALKVFQAAQIIATYELPFLVTLTDFEQKRYSGLQITHDPVSWLFWLASFVMTFGVYAILYGNWVRVWAYQKDGEVTIYVNAHKNEVEWLDAFAE